MQLSVDLNGKNEVDGDVATVSDKKSSQNEFLDKAFRQEADGATNKTFNSQGRLVAISFF